VGSSSKQPAGRGRALWAFCVAVAREFHRNQGLLLSGAVAYYTLLSMVPLFTLLLVALSHVVAEHLSYGAGVFVGCARQRSFGSYRPVLSGND
jgi:uncharacterized BrkB/YihY/UPF0761 family membrane protein